MPGATAEQHGLFAAGANQIRVVGAVHGVIDLEEGVSLIDLYLQSGPEFLSFESSDFAGGATRNGDCFEIVVEGLRVYPTWC